MVASSGRYSRSDLRYGSDGIEDSLHAQRGRTQSALHWRVSILLDIILRDLARRQKFYKKTFPKNYTATATVIINVNRTCHLRSGQLHWWCPLALKRSVYEDSIFTVARQKEIRVVKKYLDVFSRDERRMTHVYIHIT